MERRVFIKRSGMTLAGILLADSIFSESIGKVMKSNSVKINAHLWVYASKFPPNWDCTPNLEAVFADLSYAKIDGLELMESTLRHDDSVTRIKGLIDKYNLPVSGSSYGVGFNMWDKLQHKEILEDINIVVPRLSQLGGKIFGISVGNANRLKTEKELDAQAEILKKYEGSVLKMV